MKSEVIHCMADESKLDRCVRRLSEIMEELADVGLFLEKSAGKNLKGRGVKSHEEFLEMLGREIGTIKGPGYCGFKLLQEAGALIDIIGVRVQYLRGLGDRANVRKLDAIETFINEKLQPILSVSLDEMSHYSTLDEKRILEALMEKHSV